MCVCVCVCVCVCACVCESRVENEKGLCAYIIYMSIDTFHS